MKIEPYIKTTAHSLGFDLVGITTANPINPAHRDHLDQWLASGCGDPLPYMHKNLDKRVNPAALLPGARSVICVGLRYNQLDSDPAAKIASYALHEDYHPFIKERLYQLAAAIDQQLGKSARWKFKAAVDSVPLAEKSLAQRAGLGFIGRNHLLIHPQYGGSILLGELVTTLDLQPDEPMKTNCGNCDRCVRVCPTGALRPDGLLDTRRCLSCLTQYEFPGPLFPNPTQPAAAWLFGCDACLAACPYTQQAVPASGDDFKPIPIHKKISPREVLSWDENTFQKFFSGSCIRQIGLAKLKKNAQRCLDTLPPGNSGN